MPETTFLIPAYNAAETIAQTLDSLVAQTYRDFDVLVVDDASEDQTKNVADSFRDRLSLRVVSLPSNGGVASALNSGLMQVFSPYIARIDADDIAHPLRLEKQIRVLKQSPGIDVCSTWMELFYPDKSHTNHILRKPSSDAQIKTAMLQYPAISHGASIFRAGFFRDVGAFDPNLDFAEDYDLWCRGVIFGKNYCNIPEALTYYRQHPTQVGRSKRKLQYDRDLAIKRKFIAALLDGDSPGNLAEFFSTQTKFVDFSVARDVIAQSIPLLFRLARRVPDERMFSDLVSGCISRHLGDLK